MDKSINGVCDHATIIIYWESPYEVNDLFIWEICIIATVFYNNAIIHESFLVSYYSDKIMIHDTLYMPKSR